MNLFCFSLEGSMDSLYEAVQDSCEAQVYTIPSRSCSPAVLLEDNTKRRSAGRSCSMEMSQINPDNRKKKQRSLPKSVSENDTSDNTLGTNSVWPAAKKQEDLVLLRNNQNEDLRRAVRTENQTMANLKIIARNPQQESQPIQVVYYEGCKPNLDGLSSRQNGVTETVNEEMIRARGTRVKKLEKKSSQRETPTQETTDPSKGAKGTMPDVGMWSQNPDISCTSEGLRVKQIAASSRNRWSNPTESTWVQAYNPCQPQLSEHRIHTCECTASRNRSQGDKINGPNMKRDSLPKGMMRSTTSVDFCASKRSTSFGRFDTFRNQNSPSKLEENGTPETEGDSAADISEKPRCLGKKMKAISMTMRKRMGKKPVKSCSEDMADDTEGETENGSAVEKSSDRTSNSLESLYSGQSSSSGVASSSDVSSNRDSLKLEEEALYTGQFCGRAKVHTDFVPSPYDTDSLKLKVGDIISIISKPPMGIWTGMLNNKVGNFKFIYVDVLPEKEKEQEEEAPKIRPMKVCKKPRPNTLLELLERLHLEEYASSLLLNGYQTVDDLRHLKERHLIELNVTDPEHRHRLLAASDCLYVTNKEEEGEMKGDDEDEDNDGLRDSGCFIPAECPDC
ncbi:SAM domain-containing protein SAMSN-1a isoform X2 [Danio rerio]|uniref:SAM domain-containing protein SAMSN-1a isoform X2 n=1 Tax=Danio rerio TaxID=7955 RepID=A0A8M9QBV5_DANRE|nr:SAM domain-containing protein SAMSN-1 isoform X1 [Danio rerio]|eukprot:XP_021337023.1 SAM domain-containing protein SAMSN-1 isoform X1 [Danio rerio]